MNRKAVFLAFLLFVFLACLCTANAETKYREYTLSDIGLKISVPESFYTLTRDMEENDPALDYLNWNYKYTQNFLNQNDCYFDAFDSDALYEITVVDRDTTTKDFSTLDNFWISMLGSNLEKRYSEAGYSVDNSEIYTHGDLKFIKMSATVTDSSFIEYITVKNGKEIDVRIFIGNSFVSDIDKSFCEKTINSLKFGETLTEYKISELEMTIYLSNDYDVHVRGENDDSFYGSTMLYLQGEDRNSDFFFNVALAHEEESFPISFNNMDDAMAEQLLSKFQSLYEEMGQMVFDSKVVEYDGIKYLAFYMNNPISDKQNQVAYITILNGKEIVLYFYPENEKYKNWKEAEMLILPIMENVHFDSYMRNETSLEKTCRINGYFELMDNISFGMSKQEIIKVETEKYFSGKPYIWEANGNRKNEEVSFYNCQIKTFDHESRYYSFDKDGHMFYVCLSLGLDEDKDETLNEENYINAYSKLENLYGKPTYSNDGYFFPLLSDKLERWTTSIQCIQQYGQWVLEYDDYYVLAEIMQTKTTLSGIYDCFVTYTRYNKDEVVPILGQGLKLF